MNSSRQTSCSGECDEQTLDCVASKSVSSSDKLANKIPTSMHKTRTGVKPQKTKMSVVSHASSEEKSEKVQGRCTSAHTHFSATSGTTESTETSGIGESVFSFASSFDEGADVFDAVSPVDDVFEVEARSAVTCHTVQGERKTELVTKTRPAKLNNAKTTSCPKHEADSKICHNSICQKSTPSAGKTCPRSKEAAGIIQQSTKDYEGTAPDVLVEDLDSPRSTIADRKQQLLQEVALRLAEVDSRLESLEASLEPRELPRSKPEVICVDCRNNHHAVLSSRCSKIRSPAMLSARLRTHTTSDQSGVTGRWLLGDVQQRPLISPKSFSTLASPSASHKRMTSQHSTPTTRKSRHKPFADAKISSVKTQRRKSKEPSSTPIAPRHASRQAAAV